MATQSPIIEYMRRMAEQQRRMRGRSMNYGYGAMSAGSPDIPGPMAAPTAAPMAGPPSATGPVSNAPPDFYQNAFAGPAPAPGAAPPADYYQNAMAGKPPSPQPPWQGVPYPVPGGPGFTTPSTKTEPEGILKFAWGGNTPQDYQGGKTDILQMSGAPGARPGLPGTRYDAGGAFQGPSAVGGGHMSGGYGESQQDWSKVANPMAFEGYGQQLERDEIERRKKDPLWRERETAAIAQSQEIATANATAQAQASEMQRAAEAVRQRRDEMAQAWITDENKRRVAAGQPAMKLEEESQYYQMADQRLGVGTPMSGLPGVR